MTHHEHAATDDCLICHVTKHKFPRAADCVSCHFAAAGLAQCDKTTPVLDDEHTGYQQPNCSNCHTLPMKLHFATHEAECAACHGANGSCDPDASTRQHSRSERCLTCHDESQRHGFDDEFHCVDCHFADRDVVACED